MEVRSKINKCISVGYGNSQEGYKCYNPSRKLDVSMDVILLESEAYFKESAKIISEEVSIWSGRDFITASNELNVWSTCDKNQIREQTIIVS